MVFLFLLLLFGIVCVKILREESDSVPVEAIIEQNIEEETAAEEGGEKNSLLKGWKTLLADELAEGVCEWCTPFLLFVANTEEKSSPWGKMVETVWNQFPLYAYAEEQGEYDTATEDSYTVNQLLGYGDENMGEEYGDEFENLHSALEEENEQAQVKEDGSLESQSGGENDDSSREKGGYPEDGSHMAKGSYAADGTPAEEGNASGSMAGDLASMEAENQLANSLAEAAWFHKAEEKSMEYSREDLKNYDFLLKNLYTIDPTTTISRERLNGEVLLGKDITLSKEGGEPQILIYHTHSQENFVDSVPGDTSTTIVGAGEKLASLLREEYGFSVLHHEGAYDVEARDYAYSNAGPALEALLQEYPSIQVIIDLHRDEVREGTKLVTTIEGKPTAKFMFFNGLSYTNTIGDITYLENPHIMDNLAISLQMKIASDEYYPGLSRRIYLKGYRYNMHYRGKSLLVELGAQSNTVEEIMNACEPLAHVISLVLNGEEP